MARPTLYKHEFVAQAEKLCRLGATDLEIADFFKVDIRSIHRWKNEYPEFCHALKAGKEAADERVERSLYAKATGYTFEAVKIFQFEGGPVVVPYREHVPPDTTAAIFWLKNRRPKEWRDRHEHSFSTDAATADDASLLAVVRAGRIAPPASEDDPPVTH